jgi:hypothetical protein
MVCLPRYAVPRRRSGAVYDNYASVCNGLMIQGTRDPSLKQGLKMATASYSAAPAVGGINFSDRGTQIDAGVIVGSNLSCRFLG